MNLVLPSGRYQGINPVWRCVWLVQLKAGKTVGGEQDGGGDENGTAAAING